MLTPGSVQFFLNWARERTDEMDATLASLENQAEKAQAKVQAEAKQFAIGIDPMAVEAGELADRRLRDASAEFACRLRGGGVAGGLHGFPERRRGAIGLRQRRMRGQADRHHHGADSGTHDPSLAGERHAAV